MDYDFTRREAQFERTVFVLTLNRKAMTERIVIGEAGEARRRLERSTGEVFYDESRPLGTLLFRLEADPDRQWNRNAMFLHESYEKLRQTERWKLAEPTRLFLLGKYKGGEPATLYAALRTWDEYLNCYNLNHGPDLFLQRTSLLYRPFFLYGEHWPWQEEAGTVQPLHDGESQVELWYPVGKWPFECVVAFASLQPVIFYYLQRIREWGLHVMQCGVCGRDFLAPTKRYEYCSDECRKARMAKAKREFDKRAKGDRLGQHGEAAYNHWYNHLRRLKRGNADPEKLAAFQAAMGIFRSEAKRRKDAVKRGELDFSEYTGWLVAQYDEADRLAGE